MSIKGKLTIAVIIALCLVTGSMAYVLVGRTRISVALDKNNLFREIVVTLVRLNVLRAEYELTGHQRAYDQYLSQQRHLNNLLVDAASAYPDNRSVENLLDYNEQRLELFQELVSYLESEGQPPGPEDAMLAHQSTVARLLILSSRMLGDSEQLHAESQAELEKITGAVSALTIMFTGLLALTVIMLVLMVGITVLKSIREFASGAEAVASGDLGFKIAIKHNDEIGKAALVFNQMTEGLSASTCELEQSRDRLEELVRLRTEELELANAELKSYAHVVSHDLRSPLTSAFMANDLLMSIIEDLKDDELREQLENMVAINRRGLEKTADLAMQILRLAEAGQKPPDVNDVEISRIVSEVLQVLPQDTGNKPVKFEVDEDLGIIRGNRTQLYQVFSNLISNSYRHNDNPEPVTAVRYFGSNDGAHRYIVQDNGSGLDQDDIDQLFRPFFKGSKTQGIGIGLSIVFRIIEAYGGWIKAYNDNGACFEFEIPDWTSS